MARPGMAYSWLYSGGSVGRLNMSSMRCKQGGGCCKGHGHVMHTCLQSECSGACKPYKPSSHYLLTSTTLPPAPTPTHTTFTPA